MLKCPPAVFFHLDFRNEFLGVVFAGFGSNKKIGIYAKPIPYRMEKERKENM
jgi:hypothetical protein